MFERTSTFPMLPAISDSNGRLMAWRALPPRTRQFLPGSAVYLISEDGTEWRCEIIESDSLSIRYHQIRRVVSKELNFKRIHTRWRLEVSMLGEVPVCDVNGKPAYLHSGEYQLANYLEHKAAWSAGQKIHFLEAEYEAGIFTESTKSTKLRSSLIQRLTDKMWRCLHRLFHSAMPMDLRPLQVELCIKEFMLLHLAAMAAGEKDAPVDMLLNKARIADGLVERDLMGYESITNLASAVNLSPSQLKRGFRQLFGCGVFERVTWHRMAQAKRLLEHSDRTMDDIALEIGYSRRNSFAAAFKKVVGLSPQEFRRQRNKTGNIHHSN